MGSFLLTTGSITYAIKGRDLLRKMGYKARIERRTTGTGSNGCGYNILVDGDIKAAEVILRDAGIKILQINKI